MTRFILSRLGYAAVVLFGVVVAVFFLVRIGGDPSALFLPPEASAADIARFRHQMGFDRSLWAQFVDFLLRIDQSMFEPVRSPFDWLSRDTGEVDLYLADPFCGDSNPLTYGYLIDLLDTIGSLGERLGSIACPVLVIAGDHDPAGAMGAHPTDLAHRLTEANVDTKLVLYPGARHEILNETNRDEVTADIISWLQSEEPSAISATGR